MGRGEGYVLSTRPDHHPEGSPLRVFDKPMGAEATADRIAWYEGEVRDCEARLESAELAHREASGSAAKFEASLDLDRARHNLASVRDNLQDARAGRATLSHLVDWGRQ